MPTPQDFDYFLTHNLKVEQLKIILILKNSATYRLFYALCRDTALPCSYGNLRVLMIGIKL